MEKISIPVSVWKRYQTYNTEVVPSLSSAIHSFKYRNFPIKISIPRRPKKRDWQNSESPINCYGYKQRGNKKIPLSYRIHQIGAILETGKKRKILKSALATVNTSLFNKRERKSLDAFTLKHEAILDSAFVHWINVMRWCTKQKTICQLSHMRQDSHWGTYLRNSTADKNFYCPGQSFEIEIAQPVKKAEWNKAQKILNSGADVPIWQICYAEAYGRLNVGDMRGYIISLAISLETMIRHLTSIFLKDPINEKYRKIVNTIPISRIINEWYKLGFDSIAWRNLREERKVVIKIFELRNDIMHRGRNPSVSKNMQLKMNAAVRLFLEQGEKIG